MAKQVLVSEIVDYNVNKDPKKIIPQFTELKKKDENNVDPKKIIPILANEFLSSYTVTECHYSNLELNFILSALKSCGITHLNLLTHNKNNNNNDFSQKESLCLENYCKVVLKLDGFEVTSKLLELWNDLNSLKEIATKSVKNKVKVSKNEVIESDEETNQESPKYDHLQSILRSITSKREENSVSETQNDPPLNSNARSLNVDANTKSKFKVIATANPGKNYIIPGIKPLSNVVVREAKQNKELLRILLKSLISKTEVEEEKNFLISKMKVGLKDTSTIPFDDKIAQDLQISFGISEFSIFKSMFNTTSRLLNSNAKFIKKEISMVKIAEEITSNYEKNKEEFKKNWEENKINLLVDTNKNFELLGYLTGDNNDSNE
jgi:hypothetical protein